MAQLKIKPEAIKNTALPSLDISFSLGTAVRVHQGRHPHEYRAHFNHFLIDPTGPDIVENCYLYECIYCRANLTQFDHIDYLRSHIRCCIVFDKETRDEVLAWYAAKNASRRMANKLKKAPNAAHPNEIIANLPPPIISEPISRPRKSTAIRPTIARSSKATPSTTINDTRSCDHSSTTNTSGSHNKHRQFVDRTRNMNTTNNMNTTHNTSTDATTISPTDSSTYTGYNNCSNTGNRAYHKHEDKRNISNTGNTTTEANKYTFHDCSIYTTPPPFNRIVFNDTRRGQQGPNLPTSYSRTRSTSHSRIHSRPTTAPYPSKYAVAPAREPSPLPLLRPDMKEEPTSFGMNTDPTPSVSAISTPSLSASLSSVPTSLPLPTPTPTLSSIPSTLPTTTESETTSWPSYSDAYRDAEQLRHLTSIISTTMARSIYTQFLPFNCMMDNWFKKFLEAYTKYVLLTKQQPTLPTRRFIAGRMLRNELKLMRQTIKTFALRVGICQFCIDESTKQRLCRLITMIVINGYPLVLPIIRVKLGEKIANQIFRLHRNQIDWYISGGGKYGVVTTDGPNVMLSFRGLCVECYNCIAIGCIAHISALGGKVLSDPDIIGIDEWSWVINGMKIVIDTLFNTQALYVYKEKNNLPHDSVVGKACCNNTATFITTKLRLDWMQKKKNKLVDSVIDDRSTEWFDDEEIIMMQNKRFWEVLGIVTVYYVPYHIGIKTASKWNSFFSDWVFLANLVMGFYDNSLLIIYDMMNMREGDEEGDDILYNDDDLNEIRERYGLPPQNGAANRDLNGLITAIRESGNYIGPDVVNNYMKRIYEVDNIENDIKEKFEEKKEEKKEDELKQDIDVDTEEDMERDYGADLFEDFIEFKEKEMQKYLNKNYIEEYVVLDHSVTAVINHSDPSKLTLNTGGESYVVDIDDHIHVTNVSYRKYKKNFDAAYHPGLSTAHLFDCRRTSSPFTQQQWIDAHMFSREQLGDDYVNNHFATIIQQFKSKTGPFTSPLFASTVKDPSLGWKSLLYSPINHLRVLARFNVPLITFRPGNVALEQFIHYFKMALSHQRQHLSPQRVDQLLEYRHNLKILNKIHLIM